MPPILRVSSMDGNDWKVPFNIALGLHVVILLGALFLPGLLKTKPKFEDVYTIDLINVATPESSPAQASPPPAQTAPPKKAEPVKEATPPKEAVSIASEPAPEPVAEAAPISIKPSKKKKIVQDKNKLAELEKQRVDKIKRQQQLEQIKRQQQLEQIKQQQRLDEIKQQRLQEVRELEQQAADQAAKEAVSQLKEVLRESNVQSSRQSQSSTSKGAQGGGRKSGAVENQYFAAIFNTLQPYWKLPGTKEWSPDLVATIVIHIAANGEVTKVFFEKPSGDRLFDQFVLKTIHDGTPLPPIPPAMNKSSLEIGLHFKPGSIQY